MNVTNCQKWIQKILLSNILSNLGKKPYLSKKKIHSYIYQHIIMQINKAKIIN